VNEAYVRTVQLLLDIAPAVFETSVFAMKGGTALNLFVQDMPRLSVDIDVVFVPYDLPREDALKTISAELAAAQGRVRALGYDVELRRNKDGIPEQGRWLKAVVAGFFAYHAVPTNSRALSAFRYHVTNLWRRTLRRRSQKDHITWARMTRIAAAWLPLPRVLHPWPSQRFAVNHPR